jgi:pheromone shutdown protein TraB
MFGVLASTIEILVLAIAVGFLSVVPFAYWTLSERDEVMAENIEEILATNDGFNRGCLVAGRRDMDGVVEQLEESDVEVSQVHKSNWLRRSL